MSEVPKLTQGPVSSSLINLTIPMILGISSSLVAAIFETYLIGLIGTNELAAYSFTFPVIGALQSISLGLSIGLSSVLARSIGGGNQTEIKRLATDGLLLMTVVMITVSIVGALTIKPLFNLLGAGPETSPIIYEYMGIWYLGLLFFTLPQMGANALRAKGDARLSGILMVGGAIMQMILDPILILGLGGFPQLGVAGAAWAMLISRVILCALTFYILIYREDLIELSKPVLSVCIKSWKRIFAVGIPATATNLIGPVSTAIIISLLAGYGKEAVAGFGIASRLEALSVIPLFALSASIGPFVGQNWGADRRDRANDAMKLTFTWAMLWGFAISAIFFFAHEPIGRLFDDNPEVTAYTSFYLMIVPFSYGAWGVLMMASATFNSLGKPLFSTTMSLVRMFALYVPLAFIGQHYWGAYGIFGAAAASNIIMGLLGFLWNRRVYGPMIDDLSKQIN
ncbi:MAG: putative MATE family efflux protein [Patiriisocius sp.]|jgi:putative MATE family efflux protein